ncbi:MAG TPA: hypothetical protein VMF89_13710, partial [Polyangiales bacterium]|nr:hypothetical protein [Polyangiales bacterium]
MRALVEKIAWVVLAIALGIWPREGADYPSYASWVDVFASRDVYQLQSTTISPVGVPVSQWSHAPALITNAIDRALSVVPFVQTGLHSVAWLAAIVFWWALIGIVRTITNGRPVLFLLTLGMVYIGTPAGFYSIHHSSETFSLACFSLATFLALSAPAGRLRDTFFIGIACGLLLIVRVNLAMYLPMPVAIRAFVLWRDRGERPNVRQLVLHALVLGVPLLAFASQLPFFNYWMTGSHSQSPYVYGDDDFRSMDFKHPLFAAVLVHPWHGLLAYHPLFALGAVALVALALRRSLPITERILALLGMFAVLAHLYLQAAWWCWWVGTGTFGSR